MDIQEQIYVLAGVFGGISLILLLFVCYLMLTVSEIHSRLKSTNRQDRHEENRSRDDYSYANPSIVPGEELSRRGYHMQDGPQGDQIVTGGLASAGANRYLSQKSSDFGTKDASRDFSSILNSDRMVFGGGSDSGSHQRSKSIPVPAPPPPIGRPSNYNDNISYPGAPVNPLGHHRQENRGYFNRGGGY
ncbi:hypothetical protein DMENIID0001_138180 [Sergentomyia squamirostris]